MCQNLIGQVQELRESYKTGGSEVSCILACHFMPGFVPFDDNCLKWIKATLSMLPRVISSWIGIACWWDRGSNECLANLIAVQVRDVTSIQWGWKTIVHTTLDWCTQCFRRVSSFFNALVGHWNIHGIILRICIRKFGFTCAARLISKFQLCRMTQYSAG